MGSHNYSKGNLKCIIILLCQPSMPCYPVRVCQKIVTGDWILQRIITLLLLLRALNLRFEIMRGLCCWEEPFLFWGDFLCFFLNLDHPFTSVIGFSKQYFEQWNLHGFCSLIYYALFAEISNSPLLAVLYIFLMIPFHLRRKERTWKL